MRYLAITRRCSDHWYPSDARKRAIVDQYLDQHHAHLRYGVSRSAMKLIAPGVTSKTINMDDFNECKAILHKSLKDLENRLTKSAYICGDQITIADLSAACELD